MKPTIRSRTLRLCLAASTLVLLLAVLSVVGDNPPYCIPSITQQPTNWIAYVGQTANFISVATGRPLPLPQWQASANGGSFVNITDATNTTLSFVTTASDDGKQYRALFTNVCGSATSDVATLTGPTLDSIGDGILDWWRLQYFGSGATTNGDSCAACDPDNDGYTNLQEYNLATDPTNSVSYPPPATDEFVGPFSSWTNVTAFGAVGDGVSNCTAAIQDALNHLGMVTDGLNASVLFFPRGTYLITNAVRLIGRQNVQIIGEHPSDTILKLAADASVFMLDKPVKAVLQVDGVAHSAFQRLTFNGGGNANVVLVDQSKWYGESGEREVEPGIWAGDAQFDSGNCYVDCIFTNGGNDSVGIRSGLHQSGGGSEGMIVRCQFVGLTYGFLTRHANSLDWWAWNSVFKDNQVGLSNFDTNSDGFGNFSAFGCVFFTNTLADMLIKNTEKFLARDCFSSGSGMFWRGNNPGDAAAEIVLARNRILDCTSGVAVSNENLGPITLIDNILVLQTNIPSIIAKHSANPDVLTVSNRYTTTATDWCIASTTYANNGNPRFLRYDDVQVSRASLDLNSPELPTVLTNYHRRIFEVTAGASAAQIQAKIDEAIASHLRRVVVHIPSGTYNLNSTLVITNDVDLQLVGDGNSTSLYANQALAGEVIRIVGPSHAIVRNMRIDGGFQSGGRADNGITITNADQTDARVFLENCQLSICSNAMFWANGLSNVLIESHGSGISGGIIPPATVGVGLKLSGANNVHMWATAMSDLFYCFVITDSVHVVVEDSWYESHGVTNAHYANLTGSAIISLDVCKYSMVTNPFVAVTITNFDGRALLLNNLIDQQTVVSGSGTGSVYYAQAISLNGQSTTTKDVYTNMTSTTTGVFENCRWQGPGLTYPILTNVNAPPSTNFVRTIFQQYRSTSPTYSLKMKTNGVTDVRLHNVSVQWGKSGMEVRP